MSRQVNNMADVNRAFKEIYDFMDQFKNNDLDMHGHRVRNAAPGTKNGDYVTFEQLPVQKDAVNSEDNTRTLVFSKQTTVITGDTIEPYKFGSSLASLPIQVWMEARGLPTTGDLEINFEYKLNKDTDPINLLVHNLKLAPGALEGVKTSEFIDPLPKFGTDSIIYPLIINGGGAFAVSIGIVVKKIK